MKVAIIGCGKRFQTIYFEILKALNCEVFVWNRTKEKSENFCKKNNCNLVENLSEIVKIKPDIILCFVPSRHHFDILSNLPETEIPILLETPAEDNRLLSSKPNLGVLEQWPKLPLEQFKQLVYSSGVILRPYMVINDGRSFDYHAIAQLRSYMDLPTPVSAKGTIKNYHNNGILDTNKKMNTNPFEWTVGQIEMSNGGIILYNFSYNCKSLPIIPIQFLRSLSIDGSIVTGRMKELNDDYEIIDFRSLDKQTKETLIHNVKVERDKGVTKSIAIDKVVWHNPYANLFFNDQQTAIATLLSEAVDNKKIYSYKNAFIDQLCINMIKQSAFTNQTTQLSGR